VSQPVSKTRFSREEFCQLIDAHLHQLETHEEAKRRYAAVLAAIRENLEVYTKSRKTACASPRGGWHLAFLAYPNNNSAPSQSA
jgi:hypothetical protein